MPYVQVGAHVRNLVATSLAGRKSSVALYTGTRPFMRDQYETGTKLAEWFNLTCEAHPTDPTKVIFSPNPATAIAIADGIPGYGRVTGIDLDGNCGGADTYVFHVLFAGSVLTGESLNLSNITLSYDAQTSY